MIVSTIGILRNVFFKILEAHVLLCDYLDFITFYIC